MRLLSIDPGKRTGIAYHNTRTQTFWSTETPDQMEVVDRAQEGILNGSVDLVICENFIIGGKPGAVTAQPYSLEILGALRWICYRLATPFVTQNPSDRKVITLDNLRTLGWYKGQKDYYEGHADDAAMHLGAYLMAQQDQEFLKRIYT